MLNEQPGASASGFQGAQREQKNPIVRTQELSQRAFQDFHEDFRNSALVTKLKKLQEVLIESGDPLDTVYLDGCIQRIADYTQEIAENEHEALHPDSRFILGAISSHADGAFLVSPQAREVDVSAHISDYSSYVKSHNIPDGYKVLKHSLSKEGRALLTHAFEHADMKQIHLSTEPLGENQTVGDANQTSTAFIDYLHIHPDLFKV